MQGFINWVGVSMHLSGLKTTIRKNAYPKKYKKKVEQLLWYVDCWKNDIELSTMEELKAKLHDKIEEI